VYLVSRLILVSDVSTMRMTPVVGVSVGIVSFTTNVEFPALFPEVAVKTALLIVVPLDVL
jgi:hypothetical protein